MLRTLLAAASLLATTGCAGSDGAYPSLAPRTIETRGFDEPTTPGPTPAVADPVLDRQIDELDGRLRTIAQGFGKAAAEATRKGLAASGRAAGSDPWLEAQTALATLDDWRAQVSALSTDIEQIAIARATTLAPTYPALTALTDQTDAEARHEGEAITRIQAMLAPA
jgi:hypothetical protein